MGKLSWVAGVELFCGLILGRCEEVVYSVPKVINSESGKRPTHFGFGL